MDTAMVSCVIPTYKRSDSLLRAIQSVLKQTYKNIEVLVIDDNEPNDEYSLEVKKKLSKLEDERVRYISQEKHVNGAVARNVGIENAKGEYVAFLDDDDEWLELKIEKQLDLLLQNKGAKGVSCLYTIYSRDKPVRKCPPYSSDSLQKKVLDRSVSVFTSTTVFNKEALKEMGGFDEELIRHQDLQLLTDFLNSFQMVVLNEYLVKIHTDIGGNKPNVIKFIEVKNDFFKKINKNLGKYNKKERRDIYNAHYFEIILVALREKRINIALTYLIKIGFSLNAYVKFFKRYEERKKYSKSF